LSRTPRAIENAWPLARARHLPCGTEVQRLRLDDFFSPLELLRLLALLLPRARSLCASLLRVLALPPLLAAWARLEDERELLLELRDAIEMLLYVLRPRGCAATCRL
jgi:hypothetical protein